MSVTRDLFYEKSLSEITHFIGNQNLFVQTNLHASTCKSSRFSQNVYLRGTYFSMKNYNAYVLNIYPHALLLLRPLHHSSRGGVRREMWILQGWRARGKLKGDSMLV